jgi:hypothetical protein
MGEKSETPMIETANEDGVSFLPVSQLLRRGLSAAPFQDQRMK